MLSKIIVVNPDDCFTPSATDIDGQIPVQVLQSHTCFLRTSLNGVDLICENQPISLSNSYVLFRSWGMEVRDKHFVSILAECVRRLELPYSSDIFRYHSKSSSKITQAVKFALAGIPAPETIIARKESFYANEETITANLNFPCVFKRTGSSGNVVWRVGDYEKLYDRVEKSGSNLFVIQRHIENSHDFRVLVFEGEVIGVIKRESSDGFHNNVSQGGEPSIADLSQHEKKLAVKAADVAGVNFGGVDLMRDGDKTFVIEVNRSPDFSGFEQAHTFSVTEKVLDMIADKYSG